jgi:hypothetical protein
MLAGRQGRFMFLLWTKPVQLGLHIAKRSI